MLPQRILSRARELDVILARLPAARALSGAPVVTLKHSLSALNEYVKSCSTSDKTDYFNTVAQRTGVFPELQQWQCYTLLMRETVARSSVTVVSAVAYSKAFKAQLLELNTKAGAALQKQLAHTLLTFGLLVEDLIRANSSFASFFSAFDKLFVINSALDREAFATIEYGSDVWKEWVSYRRTQYTTLRDRAIIPAVDAALSLEEIIAELIKIYASDIELTAKYAAETQRALDRALDSPGTGPGFISGVLQGIIEGLFGAEPTKNVGKILAVGGAVLLGVFLAPPLVRKAFRGEPEPRQLPSKARR